jgi:hypothetical protein
MHEAVLCHPPLCFQIILQLQQLDLNLPLPVVL